VANIFGQLCNNEVLDHGKKTNFALQANKLAAILPLISAKQTTAVMAAQKQQRKITQTSLVLYASSTVYPTKVGHEFVFVFFWVALFIFMFMCVLFYLGQLSHFLSCFGAGVTNLNEPPSSFLLPPIIAG